MSFVSVMNARLVPTMGKVRIFDGVIGAVESRLLFARVYVVSPVSLLLALAPLLVAHPPALPVSFGSYTTY